MRVFISGPYTQGDVAVNVNRAMEAADTVMSCGHHPYVPHLTHFQHMCYARSRNDWLDLDMVWLEQSQCVIRLDGESPGADAEVECALRLGLPVYYGVESFMQLVEPVT